MLLYAIIFLIIGAILRSIILSIAKRAGRRLNKTFCSLGDLKGKSYEDISKRTGEANFVEGTGYGFYGIWTKRGYFIKILFDEKKNFVRIENEILS